MVSLQLLQPIYAKAICYRRPQFSKLCAAVETEVCREDFKLLKNLVQ